MKPEELQIGDIVNVHRCECVAEGGHFQEWDEYGKVVSITEDYITIKYIGREEDYGFEDVNGEDINPIPLIPEILEKNGFTGGATWQLFEIMKNDLPLLIHDSRDDTYEAINDESQLEDWLGDIFHHPYHDKYIFQK